MNTLTKMVLGLLGQLKPERPVGEPEATNRLRPPNTAGRLALMQALAKRESLRDFNSAPLAEQQCADRLCAGTTVQNVYLYCASAGLATVIRAWIDRSTLAQAMEFGPDQQMLLPLTVGRPAAGSAR